MSAQDLAPRLPTLFISHGGGPCFFMDWDPPDTWTALGDWLRGLAAQIGARPKAVLVVSAHWEAPEFSLTGAVHPELIYDYQGFPKHTYALEYAAPGAPALAERARALLGAAGLPARVDPARGWDHAVFVPLKLIYPDADVPIVELSLQAALDPETHLRAGRALSILRNEGVLIVGSGYSYHNMRGYGGRGADDADRFDAWLKEALPGDPAARAAKLAHWTQAPAARAAHPREEHLLPLMVAAGAAGEGRGTTLFSQRVLGVATSCFRFD